MLKFGRLAYKNFLSTGNVWNEYQLDSHADTLIVGKNAAGKTTLLDALCFALYGRGYRNINRGMLVNSINGKGMVVEIEFTTQNNNYLIRRGIKPSIFDIVCNGETIPAFPSSTEMQDYLEKYILQCNYKAFTQVVILGASSYVPFMRLTPAARREILEDVLDIEVFSVMQSLAKERMAVTREAITRAQAALSVVESQHALAQLYTEQWTQQQEDRRDVILSRIGKLTKQIAQCTEDRDAAVADETIWAERAAKIPEWREKQSKAAKLAAKFTAQLQHAEHQHTFFEQHDNCPTCTQVIDPEFKSTQLSSTAADLEKLRADRVEADNLSVAIDLRLKNAQDAQASLQSLEVMRKQLDGQVKSLTRELARLEEDLQHTHDPAPDPPTELGNLDEMSAALSVLIAERQVQEQTIALLKDTGIRTKIIQQYLPAINKWVNSYLQAFNFPIQFVLDEQFNETIKSRHRDEFSYENFSEGEKRRIDLSLVLTWRAIARMKNSCYTNLLLFDEVFDSSLDANGVDDFLLLLKDMEKETNVFVISHKTESLLDRFSRTIVVTKDRGFSNVSTA
jgi:DNA repair exonuclease SbcCD ATPase subunit